MSSVILERQTPNKASIYNIFLGTVSTGGKRFGAVLPAGAKVVVKTVLTRPHMWPDSTISRRRIPATTPGHDLLCACDWEAPEQTMILRAIRGLEHTNIVEFRACSQNEGSGVCHCYSPYAGPRNLHDAVTSAKAPFPPKAFEKITLQMVSALYYLHSNGFVHRNVNPRNVIVSDGFDVKLCGFSFSVTKRNRQFVPFDLTNSCMTMRRGTASMLPKSSTTVSCGRRIRPRTHGRWGSVVSTHEHVPVRKFGAEFIMMQQQHFLRPSCV